MDKVKEAKENFDRFTMTIGGNSVSEYRKLMGGTLRDYLLSAEAYLRGIAAIKQQTKKARHG